MKVLVAPLDWGLGHATRCIPVVQEFLRKGAEVELAVVKANASLFREVFPGLRQRLAPAYNIVYPKHGFGMGAWLLKNSVHLQKVMRYEHHYAEEMVEKHGYDVLFSDNRFGFYSKSAYNIYMTHQRRIAFPRALSKLESVGVFWHSRIMRKFDEVWVPDQEEFPGFAGNLSHVQDCSYPVKFIGVLSRFSNGYKVDSVQNQVSDLAKKKYNVVAVVSGVEPARTQFERQLRSALKLIPGRHVMILGKPSEGPNSWTDENIEIFNHLPSIEFAEVVRNANWVVSRGGYSTIMDMSILGAKCIFVPTPGQYEQEVLAKDLSKSGYAVEIPAKNLSEKTLNEAFAKEVKLPLPAQCDLLRQTIKSVFEKIKK